MVSLLSIGFVICCVALALVVTHRRERARLDAETARLKAEGDRLREAADRLWRAVRS